MLLGVAVLLVILWILGVVFKFTASMGLHLLLVFAVIAVIGHFLMGRKS